MVQSDDHVAQCGHAGFEFETKAAEIVALRFGHFDSKLESSIAAAIREAVDAEREECAKIADQLSNSVSDHEAGAAIGIADDIRARGK